MEECPDNMNVLEKWEEFVEQLETQRWDPDDAIAFARIGRLCMQLLDLREESPVPRATIEEYIGKHVLLQCLTPQITPFDINVCGNLFAHEGVDPGRLIHIIAAIERHVAVLSISALHEDTSVHMAKLRCKLWKRFRKTIGSTDPPCSSSLLTECGVKALERLLDEIETAANVAHEVEGISLAISLRLFRQIWRSLHALDECVLLPLQRSERIWNVLVLWSVPQVDLTYCASYVRRVLDGEQIGNSEISFGGLEGLRVPLGVRLEASRTLRHALRLSAQLSQPICTSLRTSLSTFVLLSLLYDRNTPNHPSSATLIADIFSPSLSPMPSETASLVHLHHDLVILCWVSAGGMPVDVSSLLRATYGENGGEAFLRTFGAGEREIEAVISTRVCQVCSERDDHLCALIASIFHPVSASSSLKEGWNVLYILCGIGECTCWDCSVWIEWIVEGHPEIVELILVGAKELQRSTATDHEDPDLPLHDSHSNMRELFAELYDALSSLHDQNAFPYNILPLLRVLSSFETL